MYKIIKDLPSVADIVGMLPVGDKLAARKAAFDEEIKQNIKTRKRLTVVCGPCAADNVDAVAEYVRKLKKIADDLPNLLVVARIYTSKPHSDGTGYNGIMFGDGDMTKGLLDCRKMMLDCLDVGLPVADEVLYPDMFPYVADLVSYAFIGARSSEDSLHRGVASALDIACGVKNGTDGEIAKAVDSLYAVAHPCTFPVCGRCVTTSGNENAHIVLRGGYTWQCWGNIDRTHVCIAKSLLAKKGLNGFVMADLSHANSCKMAKNQINNARVVAKNEFVDGVMAESYLYGGNGGGYGVSQTDECLGIDDTAELLKILSDGFAERR